MNRTILRQLALDRIEDSRVLIGHGRWSAAYYLLGYSVEIGLKACILRFVDDTGVIFTDKRYAEKCWTHNLKDLVKQANLEPLLGNDIGSNPRLGGNWGVVELWTEVSRYEQKSQGDAQALYDAVVEIPDGVLQWIQRHW